MGQAYNLTATLNLQQIDASQAIASLHKQLASQTFSVNVSLNTANAIRQAGQLNQAMASASSSVKGLATAQTQATTSTNTFAQAQGGLVRQFVATHQAAINTRREFSTFFRDIATLTGSVLSLHRGLVLLEQAWSSIQQMNKAKIQLGQITSQSTDSKPIQAMEQSTRNAAKQYGTSSNKLMGQAVELSQAGFDDSQIKGLMGTLAKLNLNEQLSEAGLKDLTNSMIVLKQTFGQAGPEIEKSLGSILEATKKYAVSNSDLLEMMKRSGSVFKAYGSNINELIALETSVRQATRLTPQVVATGMNSSISRMYSQPKSREEVERLGVKPFDDNGKAKDVLQVMTELSKAMSKLSDAERLEATYKIAGARNATVFLSAVSQSGAAVQIYNDLLKAENRITEDAAIAMGGFESKLTRVKETWLALASSMANSKAFQTLTTVILELGAALAKVAPLMLSLAAMKFGGMAGSALAAMGSMGGGFPQTKFATGFNRFVQPMPNSEHEGWESPSLFQRGRYALNRSGNAAIGGVANFAKRNAGGLMMMGGMGLEYASQSIEPESMGGVLGKTALSAGAGALMGGAMGGIPGAVIGGATAALMTFTSALQEASKHLLTHDVAQAGGAIKTSMAQTGTALDPSTMQRFEQLYTNTQQGIKDSRDVGGFHSYMSAVIHPGDAPEDRRNAIKSENYGQVIDTLKLSTDDIIKARDEIIANTSNIDQFAKYSNGFGQKILTLGQLLDSQFSANILNQFKAKTQATNVQQGENYAADKAQREKEYAKQMAEQAKAMHTGFGYIQNTASRDMAYGHGQLAIAQQSAEFQGKHLATGDIHENLVKRSAEQLGGSSNANELADRLRQLVDTQNKQKSFGNSESFAPIINSTVKALEELANASNRTTGYFAQLNEVTQQLHAKMGVAEAYYSSNKEGRQSMQANKQAFMELIAGGGNLNDLSIDKQQQALAHMNLMGNVKGIVPGSEYTGNQIKESVLQKSTGGAFSPELNEKASLEQTILGVMQSSNDAQKALAEHEASLQSQFFSQLTQANTQFLTMLKEIWGVKTNPVPTMPALPNIAAMQSTTQPLNKATVSTAITPPTATPNTNLPAIPSVGLAGGLGVAVQPSTTHKQTGVDLQALAQKAMEQQLGFGDKATGPGIADKLIPDMPPDKAQPLMSWRQLPDISSQAKRGGINEVKRAKFIQGRLAHGADPKQIAQYAGQLGLNPASFSQEHRAALDMGLNVRAKGYLTRSKIDELKQQGVSFDPNESGGQPLWNRMATEHLGRQSHARAIHPHGEHSHEATQRSNEVTHVHKHEGGEAIAQAAARLEKAMQGDSLHEFANVFGQHTTRLQTAIDKQSTQTGSNATATATQPGAALLGKDADNSGGGFAVFGQYTASFDTSVKSFGGYIGEFNNAIATLGKSMANFPTHIMLTGNHTIDVNVSGNVASTTSNDKFKDMVLGVVGPMIDDIVAKLPGLTMGG
jgi:TP901 family phage tail tape measure protein